MTQETTPNAGGFRRMGDARKRGSAVAATAVTILAGLAIAAGVAFSQTEADPSPAVNTELVEKTTGSGEPGDWVIGGAGVPEYAKAAAVSPTHGPR